MGITSLGLTGPRTFVEVFVAKVEMIQQMPPISRITLIPSVIRFTPIDTPVRNIAIDA